MPRLENPRHQGTATQDCQATMGQEVGREADLPCRATQITPSSEAHGVNELTTFRTFDRFQPERISET